MSLFMVFCWRVVLCNVVFFDVYSCVGLVLGVFSSKVNIEALEVKDLVEVI